MGIFNFLFVFLFVEAVHPLTCIGQNVTIYKDGSAVLSKRFELQCNTSCDVRGHQQPKDGDFYLFETYCDDEGDNQEGCYFREDGTKHCTCYENCETKIGESLLGSYLFQTDEQVMDKYQIKKCFEYTAQIVNGELKYSTGDNKTEPSANLRCPYSCHSIIDEIDGEMVVKGGCNPTGLIRTVNNSCVLENNAWNCACKKSYCNLLETKSEFEEMKNLRSSEIAKQEARKPIMCATYDGQIKSTDIHTNLPPIENTECRSMCVMLLSRNETGLYNYEGLCMDNFKEMTYFSFVKHPNPTWVYFSSPVQKLNDNCALMSEGQRCIVCQCEHDGCNILPDDMERSFISRFLD